MYSYGSNASLQNQRIRSPRIREKEQRDIRDVATGQPEEGERCLSRPLVSSKQRERGRIRRNVKFSNFISIIQNKYFDLSSS